MNDVLVKLFPQGQRKLIVSLIGLAVAIAFEKFTKQGLSEEMKTSILALVAIFTGGNVMEHFANAIKAFKGTKIGAIIEDVLPGDQGLKIAKEEVQAEEAAAPDYTEHIKELYAHAKGVNEQIAQLKQSQQLQAENTQKIIAMINSQRAGKGE